jgi:hypothetical protein
MIAMLLYFVMAMTPFPQTPGNVLPFEIRADKNLIFGKGETSSETYYDASLPRSPQRAFLSNCPIRRRAAVFLLISIIAFR